MTWKAPDRLTRVLTAAGAVALLLLCAAATTRLMAMAQPAQAPVGTSVWTGAYTGKQAVRGKKTYEDECAQCHPAGAAGEGAAPALAGPAFTARWREQTVGDIFVTTRTTMPPAAPASLSKEAYVDIVAYLLQANNFPAGNTELVPETNVLGQIFIDKEPPQ